MNVLLHSCITVIDCAAFVSHSPLCVRSTMKFLNNNMSMAFKSFLSLSFEFYCCGNVRRISVFLFCIHFPFFSFDACFSFFLVYSIYYFVLIFILHSHSHFSVDTSRDKRPWRWSCDSSKGLLCFIILALPIIHYPFMYKCIKYSGGRMYIVKNVCLFCSFDLQLQIYTHIHFCLHVFALIITFPFNIIENIFIRTFKLIRIYCWNLIVPSSQRAHIWFGCFCMKWLNQTQCFS